MVAELVEGCEDDHDGTLADQSNVEAFESWSAEAVGRLGPEDLQASERYQSAAGERRDRSYVEWCFVVVGSYHHSTSS